MKYRNIEQYKYQLMADEKFETGILGYSFKTPFIELDPEGIMTLKDGYLSDGASGPTHDDEENMRAAFGHDGLYELMRRGLLPIEIKDTADRLLHKWMLEAGASEVRANYYYDAVHNFAWHTCIAGTETKDIILEV